MNQLFKRGLVLASLAAALCFAVGGVANADEPQAKNVILFIGDGMGYNSDIMGSYWRTGKEFGLAYQKFPVKGAAATFCVHKHSNGVAEWNIDEDFGYVPKEFWKGPGGAGYRHTNTETTDSAASATAINSGQKTLGGRLNISMTGEKLENFADKNYKAGRSVGVVTSTQISHATPAGASAHNDNRGNYEQISQEQINDLPLTVLMGSGHPVYSSGKKRDKSADELDYKFVGGREVWDQVSKNEGYKGWTFIDDRADFAALAANTPDKKADLPKKVLGVARTTGDMQPIDGDADDPESMIEKFGKETVEAIPSLTEMTVGALNVLAQNDKGFYLMVEGANIDHANHGNNAPNSCLEHAGFSKAIDAAIEWVEKYSSWDETIMIVTSDHETGQIWGAGTFDDANDDGKFKEKDDDTFNEFEPVPETDKGEVPEVQYMTTGHSNSLVPVYIKGAGADNYAKFVRGEDEKAGEMWKFDGKFIYNSDIFNIMSAASGVK
ncbi:MAG: alkaline phosphatase [Thermoguttaceae bacterium]|nr:alkaline phosphatase [Thermoguttaceae bacterium]